jgi:AraC family transcriptional regulator, dual regulator of chb operon
MNKLRWKKIVIGNNAFHIARTEITHLRAPHIHTHDFAELFWIEDGNGEHLINGKIMPLAKGDLVLIRPSDAHGFRTRSKPFILVNLAFPPSALHFLRERYFQNQSLWFWARSKLPVQHHFSSASQPRMKALLSPMFKIDNTSFQLERFLMNLFHFLREEVSVSSKQTAPDWLLSALRKIQEPASFTGGTRAFARLASRCPEYVNRQLQKHFSLTTTDAVNHARLDYAAHQFRTTQRKIIDVAFECGFSHLGYFYKLFQRRYRITPHQYQRHHEMFFG